MPAYKNIDEALANIASTSETYMKQGAAGVRAFLLSHKELKSLLLESTDPLKNFVTLNNKSILGRKIAFEFAGDQDFVQALVKTKADLEYLEKNIPELKNLALLRIKSYDSIKALEAPQASSSPKA